MENQGSEQIQELKTRGNEAYTAGNYREAIDLFTQAIEIDNTNGTLFCNRSMAFSSLLQWEDALQDAKMAIKLSPKYEKAYFRLVKALIQLNRIKEARMCLIIGFNECGDAKHLKILEKEIFELTGIPARPKPHDFETIDELGDGNFSKIYKAIHKPTEKIYAIKTIEKMTVDRMKRRHPNIHNEILIEKRTLNKLDHPNIVILHATFQDYGTLYYQMEYLEGGEIWSFLQDEQTKASVGCYPSLARFWIAEAINALEYMHKRGIVHRDVKPENMILTAQGLRLEKILSSITTPYLHPLLIFIPPAPSPLSLTYPQLGRLKFVDFGTCKDLISTDLNGQEFVGTAEYMSPEVVKSKPSGPETDLWSLGVVIYQMMVGYTPFLASSPYLSFLRIKRGFLRIPRFFDAATTEIISLLIQKDKKERFLAAASMTFEEGEKKETGSENVEEAAAVATAAAAAKSSFSYDKLRNLSFFKSDPEFVFPNPFDATQLPVRVPSLKDISLRAVGRTCLVVAEKVAINGGSKIGLDQWIQNFTLSKLPTNQRDQLLHYLNRRGDAHNPAVYRLFWNSVVDARCNRSEWTEREVLGFNRHTQGRYTTPFSFAYINDPLFGITGECETQERNMKTIVSTLNKLRPKFIIISGNFTSVPRDSTAEALQSVDAHVTQSELFRRSVARVSETIPVFFVPGDIDLDVIPTPQSLERYHRLHGCDFYGFWYSGIRFIIINTVLMLHPENVPDHAHYQEVWLEEELEQCKLCATQVIIFSHHPWFVEHGEEEEEEGEEEKGEEEKGPHHGVHKVMPKHLRNKWLPKMRHQKIKFLFTSKYSNPLTGQTIPSFKSNASSATKSKSKEPQQSESPKPDQAVNELEGAVATTGIADNEEEIIKPSPDWKELPRSDGQGEESSESESESENGDDNNNDDDEIKISKKRKDDDNSPFSPDLKYFGPIQISTPALATMTENSEVIRLVEIIDEEVINQHSYSLRTLPTKLII